MKYANTIQKQINNFCKGKQSKTEIHRFKKKLQKIYDIKIRFINSDRSYPQVKIKLLFY